MILIKNCRIVDGLGAPPGSGDVLIKNDRISAVGSNLTLPHKDDDPLQVIDAKGKTVMPGLIDAH